MKWYELVKGYKPVKGYEPVKIGRSYNAEWQKILLYQIPQALV